MYSVFRETLRYYAPMGSPRFVEADTTIANQYLVRKGTVVQPAPAALHQDKDVWGADAEEFNPDRFLHSANCTKTNHNGTFEDKSSVPGAAFRSFGGGRHMCPRRNFAAAEILSLSAAVIMGFDMEVVDTTAWNPPPDRKRVLVSVMKPLEKLMVKMHRRQGYENVQWKLQLRSKSIWTVSACSIRALSLSTVIVAPGGKMQDCLWVTLSFTDGLLDLSGSAPRTLSLTYLL